jgi:hypothetical protein
MGNLAVKAILLLMLPTIVFIGGVYIMSKLSGRASVTYPLQDKAEPRDEKPLNQRVTGYDIEGVSRYWGALDANARTIEQRFLEMDLVFPFFYGAALAGALLFAWAALGRPFHPVWLLSPIVITVVADWIENLVQIGELKLYAEHGKAGLQSGWILIASTATVIKLVFFFSTSLLLVGLTVWMVIRSLASRS